VAPDLRARGSKLQGPPPALLLGTRTRTATSYLHPPPQEYAHPRRYPHLRPTPAPEPQRAKFGDMALGAGEST